MKITIMHEAANVSKSERLRNMTAGSDDTHRVIKNPLDVTFYRIHQVNLVMKYNYDPLSLRDKDTVSDAVNEIISSLIMLTHGGFDKPHYLLKRIASKDHEHELREFLIRKEKKLDELKDLGADHFLIMNVFTSHHPFNETCNYLLNGTQVKDWCYKDKKEVRLLHLSLNRLSSVDIKKTIFFLDLLSNSYEYEIRRCIGEP